MDHLQRVYSDAMRCACIVYGILHRVIDGSRLSASVFPRGIALTMLFAESWSVWRRDGPQLIRSCGQENYCCQESGKNTSCCLNKLYFNLAKVKSEQTVIALSTEITRSVVVSNSSQPTSQPLSTPSTSANPASSHTTSGLLSSSTTSQSTYPPIANPTTSSDPIVENSATNKGLAAGLGLTLALAGIGGIFGLYKYHQRRRRTTKKTQTIHSRMRDLVPDQLPQHPIETNGYTEWEMSTPGNTHEAPDTAQRQASRRTRRSRLGF